MATLEMYRSSTIGICLSETLDTMVGDGILSPELAYQVLIQFDKSIVEALGSQVNTKVSFKGLIRYYNNVEGVWIFDLRKAQVKIDQGPKIVTSVKVVVCDSKLLTQ
ncbi:hypothetical protein ABFS82_02G043600 [Erythranthe guttata]|uniref:Transcription initiation factor IIA subunit 2 n=1 Tax=Erythranthe guttata TaxID=4155 RepID=A0A022RBE5_ERYGU|nr:hypothetical protein MIMGU_mgv1a018226mg [Erythranthe guttata]